ncbi:hypothetical protein PORCRE_130 [Porphyromonas crevioricanis JCM 15906]|uniref:Uncharacterized protein n=1 Tax=Porphyromonas crevioricanis JCM 15906 TaxID=1305617 RepID=S4N962_9PORP|nr:hypothetical protein PORCRE_130 [Porphyromonas crevioricanis JCM 15906]GAD07031.1 hypothetical protein PORCAN_644 [Porphyromonas crevioricanis JCM 13913]
MLYSKYKISKHYRPGAQPPADNSSAKVHNINRLIKRQSHEPAKAQFVRLSL